MFGCLNSKIFLGDKVTKYCIKHMEFALSALLSIEIIDVQKQNIGSEFIFFNVSFNKYLFLFFV